MVAPHHNLTLDVSAPPEHKMERWIIQNGTVAIGARCACGVEKWDGSRFVKGNQEEVVSKMLLHVKGIVE